jgi:hypothetical protein
MKKCLLLAATLVSTAAALAQADGGVFTGTGRGAVMPFVTDYQAIGINPANLDLTPRYENTTVTFGFAEGSAGMFSEFFSREEVANTLLRRDFETLNQQERREYAENFQNKLTTLNVDVITSGVSVRTNNAGTFAFSTRERIDMSARFGEIPSQLLFLGSAADYFSQVVLMNGDTIPNTGNLSADTLQMIEAGIVAPEDALSLAQALDQTSIGFGWIREFNLAYGKRLLKTETLEVHGGIGAKLLVGNGWLQVDVDGTDVQVFSALSPVFGVDYGEIAQQNPTAFDPNAPSLKPVGLGWGIDLGATVVLKEKLLLSAAINDIGQMTWDGNLYELNDQLLTEFTDPGAETADVIDEVINFSSADSYLDWQGTSSRTTNLPTQARLGAGFIVSPKLRLAADAVLPVNDNVIGYQDPVIALGADVNPLPFIQLSAGVIRSEADVLKIPAGVTFIAGQGRWEAGFASRDLITWFTQENPTVSFAWGFLRFRV